MIDKKIVFSIIIPSFNRASLIEETIESLLSQSYKDYEIIVVNDGSTDDTLQVLNKYKDSILIINQQNQGAEIARNNGVKYANGDYLIFLDSDDILLPDTLMLYARLITAENQPAALFAKGRGFNDNQKLSELKQADKQIITYTPVKDYYSKTEPLWLATSFIVFKRSLWNEKTFFKKGTVDDLDFILRIGILEPFIIIKSPVSVAYRQHPGNSIHDVLINLVRLSNMLKLEQHGEYPGGKERKKERLAIIGGHILEWSLKGIKKKHYKESITLLIKGIPSIIAGSTKKIRNRNMKPEIRKIQITDLK